MEEMNLKLTFENNWNRSCLVVDTSAPYTEDYQIKMLKNNSVPGLLKIAGNGLEGKSRYLPGSGTAAIFSEIYQTEDFFFNFKSSDQPADRSYPCTGKLSSESGLYPASSGLYF